MTEIEMRSDGETSGSESTATNTDPGLSCTPDQRRSYLQKRSASDLDGNIGRDKLGRFVTVCLPGLYFIGTPLPIHLHLLTTLVYESSLLSSS